jgi:endoglucanase
MWRSRYQYVDTDGSGRHATCVSPTIGAERIQNVTAWLQQNKLKGYPGEIGGDLSGARRRARNAGRGR